MEIQLIMDNWISVIFESIHPSRSAIFYLRSILSCGGVRIFLVNRVGVRRLKRFTLSSTIVVETLLHIVHCPFPSSGMNCQQQTSAGSGGGGGFSRKNMTNI